jgi:hypothetical protein
MKVLTYLLSVFLMVFIPANALAVSAESRVEQGSKTDYGREIGSGYFDANSLLIIIYYGLNDSHSRSWVQENEDGVVGITYFQRFEDSIDEGTLIYKTIHPDRSENTDTVTSGKRLEKSVLLYDSLSSPHIFVACSDTSDQIINHFYENDTGQWQCDTIIHFYNEGGKFIYELSADTGPDHSFHLLILKSRSDVDSDDYMDAWLNSYLYHLTNATGVWEKELVHNYNMAYTYDHYIKSSSRQDIKIDKDGYVHVVFGEQINGYNDPSRLRYATNKTGDWQIETALNFDYGERDDAGWFPSLCLDTNDIPHVTCMYVNRVFTRSAVYCKLFFLKRLGPDDWHSEIIAEHDDGYYASDGRDYTGALSHLVFDSGNTPHVIFSDIASAHWGLKGYNRLNVGNIRYGIFEDGAWKLNTIYRQPLPTGFLYATEMFGMCLVVSDKTDTIRVIGQELEVNGEYQYTCRLVDFAWAGIITDTEDEAVNSLPDQYRLCQNYPNPFNPKTSIMFDLPRQSQVTISVYNLLGQRVKTLVEDNLPAGHHTVSWDGTDYLKNPVSSGIYFYRFQAGDYIESRKLLLLK